jgi:class 3 adenylate cyclase
MTDTQKKIATTNGPVAQLHMPWRKARDAGGVIHGFEFQGARLMLVTVPSLSTRRRVFTVFFTDLAFTTAITQLDDAKAYAEKLLGGHMTRLGQGLARLSAAVAVQKAA